MITTVSGARTDVNMTSGVMTFTTIVSTPLIDTTITAMIIKMTIISAAAMLIAKIHTTRTACKASITKFVEPIVNRMAKFLRLRTGKGK